MKKLLIAFSVSVYLVPVSVFHALLTISKANTENVQVFGSLIIPMLLMIFVCVLVIANIVAAVFSAIRSQYLSFRTALIFKLVMIPFYIVNFAVWLIGAMIFHTSFLVIPMLPLIIPYTYFTVLATSAHTISGLCLLRPKGFVKHCVLQMIFVLDAIDCIVLAIKYSPKKHNA